MSIIDRFREKITQYIEVRVKLFKIGFIGTTANLLSYFIFVLIGLFLFFCIMLLLGLGLVELFVMAGLTKLAGLFITIGIYIIFLVLLVLLRGPITRFFAGGVITVLTEHDKDDDDDENDDNK